MSTRAPPARVHGVHPAEPPEAKSAARAHSTRSAVAMLMAVIMLTMIAGAPSPPNSPPPPRTPRQRKSVAPWTSPNPFEATPRLPRGAEPPPGGTSASTPGGTVSRVRGAWMTHRDRPPSQLFFWAPERATPTVLQVVAQSNRKKDNDNARSSRSSRSSTDAARVKKAKDDKDRNQKVSPLPVHI